MLSVRYGTWLSRRNDPTNRLGWSVLRLDNLFIFFLFDLIDQRLKSIVKRFFK
jgi:hypothetical protein